MNAPAQLVRYDAMVYAIAECHRVDEVKDLHDKALALEIYAKQANNTEAERKACDIRIRAEVKAGELLAAMQRNPGPGRGKKNGNGGASLPRSEYSEAVETAGINPRTAQRWQELAAVPKPILEEALRDPVRKPSTTRIIQQVRDPQPKLADDALWIWGRARDFERDGFAQKNPQTLFDGMTDTMRDDMRRIIPMMVEFFNQWEAAL